MENENQNSQVNDEWQIDNLPNRLTIFRVALIPVIVVMLGTGFIENGRITEFQTMLGWLAALIFMAASFTDYLDGHYARKRQIVTVFGTFLDPIADKFLVVSSLILLQGLGRVQAILVIILVLREMYMTSLRLLATERSLSVPVDKLGKWKTATQMMAIPMLMIYDDLGPIPLDIIGTIFIYIAAFLSLYSASNYTFGLVKKIRQLKQEAKKD